MNKKLINHVAIVLDGSQSMHHLVSKVRTLANDYINELKAGAKKNKQEVKISVYSFSDSIKNLTFEADDAKVDSTNYAASGNTALVSSTLSVIEDLESIPTKYGDHSFLVVVFTDGENNRDLGMVPQLKSKLENSKRDDFTVTIFVPSQRAFNEANSFGFPDGNIKIWEVSEKGFEKGFEEAKASTQSYYAARSAGVKNTKSFFKPNVDWNKKDVQNLDGLKADEYMLIPVRKKEPIKAFVESWTQAPYAPGSAYFQLTKPETVQPYKQVAIVEKATGKVFSGANARNLIGLPDFEVKVDAASHPKFEIFIQSNSTNRNLVPSTRLLILK